MTHTCDTSVLVAALASWHPRHDDARHALGRVGVLGAHVLIESYSVLTRLPAPHRLTAAIAQSALAALEIEIITLSGMAHRDLLGRLAAAGVRGGAVYDGLVAATALEHGSTLLTMDRRARATYDVVGARFEVV